MSAQNMITVSSARAIANGVSLAGIKLGEKFTIDKSVNAKEIGMDSLIIAVSTLSTGIVNSLVAKWASMPAFMLTIEETWGLDLMNLILFVIFSKLASGDLKGLASKSVIKLILEGVAALILGGYIVAPIANALPWTMSN